MKAGMKVSSSNDVIEYEENTQQKKKRYAPPSLNSLGKLSSVTLGGSPGFGDSGPPGFPQKLP